jgi:hypothetical protein
MAPDLWSGLISSDHAVRAAANLYLRWAGSLFANSNTAVTAQLVT